MDGKILISASASSSSLGPLKPPPLLRLPDELLDDIMRHAYEGKDAPSSRPVSRRLWPQQERQLCRRARLVSVNALESFSKLIQRKPSFARIVASLDIHMRRLESDSDAVAVASDQLHRLVHHLQRLQDVRVAGVSELVDIILTIPVTSLSKLRRLELEPGTVRSPSGASSMGGEGWLASLSRLPALEHLKFGSDFTFSTDLLERREPDFVLARLASLHLSTYTFSDLGVLDLVAIMPKLVELEVIDEAEDWWLDRALRAVPVGLRKLAVCASSDDDGRPYHEYCDLVTPRSLSRFSHLERLEFGGFVFDGDLFPSLAALPRLRHLVFRRHAELTHDIILGLATTHRPPALELVTLDHVANARGPSFLDNGLQWDERARSTNGHALPGWRKPIWPFESFGSDQSAAIKALERAGIAVEGTALGAVGWDRAHATESFLGKMLMCIHDGCMSEVERAWGEDEAAAALRDFDYASWLRFYAGTAHDDRNLSELDADEDRWY
ncbi:hypothetical protein JCM9279_000445 [Rhodotorula babjevae]